VRENIRSTAEVPTGALQTPKKRTESAKGKLGILHACCTTGNLNNRPSDPLKTRLATQPTTFSGNPTIQASGMDRRRITSG
jgi:hypothetical protein